jgi:hypothetical protein
VVDLRFRSFRGARVRDRQIQKPHRTDELARVSLIPGVGIRGCRDSRGFLEIKTLDLTPEISLGEKIVSVGLRRLQATPAVV